MIISCLSFIFGLQFPLVISHQDCDQVFKLCWIFLFSKDKLRGLFCCFPVFVLELFSAFIDLNSLLFPLSFVIESGLALNLWTYCFRLQVLEPYRFHLSKECCSCYFCSWDFTFAPGLLGKVSETRVLPLCVQCSASSRISWTHQHHPCSGFSRYPASLVFGRLNGLG